MEQDHKYHITEPRASNSTLPFSIDLSAKHKNQHLNEDEREQSSIDYGVPPIFIDLAAADTTEHLQKSERGQYPNDDNIDRPSNQEEQQFITPNQETSHTETITIPITKRSTHNHRSSRYCCSHQCKTSHPSLDCCCCCCDCGGGDCVGGGCGGGDCGGGGCGGGDCGGGGCACC